MSIPSVEDIPEFISLVFRLHENRLNYKTKPDLNGIQKLFAEKLLARDIEYIYEKLQSEKPFNLILLFNECFSFISIKKD